MIFQPKKFERFKIFKNCFIFFVSLLDCGFWLRFNRNRNVAVAVAVTVAVAVAVGCSTATVSED